MVLNPAQSDGRTDKKEPVSKVVPTAPAVVLACLISSLVGAPARGNHAGNRLGDDAECGRVRVDAVDGGAPGGYKVAR